MEHLLQKLWLCSLLIMHLLVVILGRGEGQSSLGTYVGIASDLLTFAANF